MGKQQLGQQQNGVSRRRLLKLLAAAGLAVSVEQLLPGGWLRPAASVSADVEPIYPGTCTALDYPIFITNSSATLFNDATALYRVDFELNEVGDFLNNEALLYVSVLKGQTIYDGTRIMDANGELFKGIIGTDDLNCTTATVEGESNSEPDTPIYNGSGSYYFYDAGANASAARDAVTEQITIEWFLRQPEDRTTNIVQTTADPLAISLSDFTIDRNSSGVKTAAAAGALTAAALGAATVKALSQKGDKEAPEDA